jgi:hypothetical protein
MANLTVILPDTIPIMALFNFAQDNGLRPYWKDANTMEFRPIQSKVVSFQRGLNLNAVHASGAVVSPSDEPTPPRAA